MKTSVLYTDGNQECDRIRMLLKSLNGEYLEYTLGRDFTEEQFQSEFGEQAQYPQITIGYEHIGGLKDVLHYFQKEGLI